MTTTAHKRPRNTPATTAWFFANPAGACRVYGHIKTPIYVEEDGHCDEFYCKRCGRQI